MTLQKSWRRPSRLRYRNGSRAGADLCRGARLMKIVFLDIDGVLNTRRSCHAQRGRPRPFDVDAISALNRVLRQTGARVVMSSTWRIKPNTWTHERRLEWLNELLELE